MIVIKTFSFLLTTFLYVFVANSTNIFINYSGGKGSCPNVKVKIIIKCVHDDDNDKKITLDSFDQDQCSYVFIFNSKLICKNE